MGPRVVGGVETLLGRRVGVNLANEGEGTVEVGVPRDGADSQEGRGGKGSARVDERLEKPTKLNTQTPQQAVLTLRTSNAPEEVEEVEAKRTRC